MALFVSIIAMLIGFVDLLKLAINTPLSGSDPTPVVQPAIHKIPTMTSVSTRPTATADECMLWDKVIVTMEGRNINCIYGNVVDYVEKPTLNATYFYFGSREQFYFVATDVYFPQFKDGDCAKSSGVVQLDTYKIPYIKIDELFICD